MERTDLFFRDCVNYISDTFDLEPTSSSGTRIMCTTVATVFGCLRPLKAVVFRFGLKAVHRYVFRNWAALRSQAGRPN